MNEPYNKDAFGTIIGSCDNCRRVLYKNSTRYLIRFNYNQFCFCDYCVEVVEPKPPEEDDEEMSNWRNDNITEKQQSYILELREHSQYQLPEFTGTTKGEAADYINRWTKLAHESLWAIEHGY